MMLKIPTRVFMKRQQSQDAASIINDQSREAIEERVRLSCDVTRSTHRNLKVFAAQQGKTILQVVEELIATHCHA